MEWLNYHHLLHFWVVAKEGTIAAACKELNLAQPTISAQIRSLEHSLGEKLFTRVGRNLARIETGRAGYWYADEIFSLGRDLLDTVQGRPTGRPLRFNVGVADVLPKLVAYKLLEPALHLPEQVKVVGRLEFVRERFYEISVEKEVEHPAVLAIADEARQKLFG